MPLKHWILLVAAVAAMWSIVPLMVWAGTGSWRRAVQALREYLGVMAALTFAGGGLGLLMTAAEAIG